MRERARYNHTLLHDRCAFTDHKEFAKRRQLFRSALASSCRPGRPCRPCRPYDPRKPCYPSTAIQFVLAAPWYPRGPLRPPGTLNSQPAPRAPCTLHPKRCIAHGHVAAAAMVFFTRARAHTSNILTLVACRHANDSHRLWLSPPGDRPLPPSYAARFGTVAVGDRGGILCPGTKPTVPLEVLPRA